MELKLRFTNKTLRTLKDDHGIDLLQDTDAMGKQESRLLITQAGMGWEEMGAVAVAVDSLTPGEHIGMLNDALIRDLIPQSVREANAKAAADPKSPEAITPS